MVKRQVAKGDSAEAGPQSVRAVTASAKIYAILRDQIVGMQVKPGATLSEKEICDTFGVSRTPVREALLRLNDENLIDIFPQMGTFVSRISFTSIRDAMVVRQALERTTVREAAKRATRVDIAALQRTLNLQERFQEAGSFDAFHEADENFHQAIATIAGHPNLWRIIKREKAHVDRFRMLTLPMPGRLNTVIRQHTAVVEALAENDIEAAEATMSNHLQYLLPSFDEIKNANPDFFESEDNAASRPKRAARA